jgi:hypothetical protein
VPEAVKGLILQGNFVFATAGRRLILVDNLCISIDGQNQESCYDVFSSLKERSGQRRVKSTWFAFG